MKYSKEEIKVMATMVIERLDDDSNKFGDFEKTRANFVVLLLSRITGMSIDEVILNIRKLCEG